MPCYEYEALNQNGDDVKGVVEARNEVGAIDKLRNKGYLVTKFKIEGSGGPTIDRRPKIEIETDIDKHLIEIRDMHAKHVQEGRDELRSWFKRVETLKPKEHSIVEAASVMLNKIAQSETTRHIRIHPQKFVVAAIALCALWLVVQVSVCLMLTCGQ